MSLEHWIIKMKARESEWGKNRTGDDWQRSPESAKPQRRRDAQ